MIYNIIGMKNIECEERVMISFDQYTVLVAAYVAKDPHFRLLEIENTYLDDENLSLKNKHHVLRIRKTNNEYELTLKIKGDNGDIEINETPDNHPEIDRYLNNQFDLYKPITSLKTRRIEAKIDDYLVVIDMNKYNGIIDYDLEVEASNMDRAKEVMANICQEYKIEYKKDYISKSSRAFNTRKNN